MNMSSYNCCNQNTAEFKKIVSLLSLLKLIAEENRLKLLCILQGGKHCVCEIINHLNLSQSLISHHLADLKNNGLIIDQKRGRYVYYSLTKKGKKFLSFLKGVA